MLTPDLKSRRTIALAIFCVALPAGFLLTYLRRFGYSVSIVPAGLLLWGLGLGLVTCSALLVTSLVGRPADVKRRALVIAGCIGFYIAAVGLIYTGTYLSNAAWGDALSYRLVVTFATYSGSAFNFLPISDDWRATVVVLTKLGVLGSLGVMSAGAAWLAWPLSRYLAQCTEQGFRNLRTNARTIAALMCVPGVGIFLLAHQINNSPHNLRGEPLASFLMLVSAGKLLEMDNARWGAALADQAALSSFKAPAIRPRKNVVLVISDALRADRMGVYGYSRDTTPFLSELFASGKLHKVEMALSTCSESFCGIASTLASRPFHEISMLNFRLNTLLKRSGYKVHYYLSGDHRSWPYLWDYYGDDIDRFYDFHTIRAPDLHDDRHIITAASRIEAFSGQPGFMYFFLMSSHLVGTRIKELQKFQPAHSDTMRLLTFWNEVSGTARDGDKVKSGQRLTREELEPIRNRYDNGVLQVDYHLRSLFDILQRKGYLENSMVVILGDHGEGLGERGYVGHSRTLYQETIRIPLLIYDSEPGKYRNGTFAVQPDIAPTIADRLGLPIPAAWQGRSLLQSPADRITLHQTRRGQRPCFAVVEHAAEAFLKYLRCGDGKGGVIEEVYDLVADPDEKVNLVTSIATNKLSRLRRADASRARLLSTDCKSLECVD